MAPGITAPFVSVTVPETRAKAPDCAWSRLQQQAMQHVTNNLNTRFIVSSTADCSFLATRAWESANRRGLMFFLCGSLPSEDCSENVPHHASLRAQRRVYKVASGIIARVRYLPIFVSCECRLNICLTLQLQQWGDTHGSGRIKCCSFPRIDRRSLPLMRLRKLKGR